MPMLRDDRKTMKVKSTVTDEEIHVTSPSKALWEGVKQPKLKKARKKKKKVKITVHLKKSKAKAVIEK